uniref:Uncharacterized protein n=1 Tax=Glossina brevipalpis TaxID=37001 RepID=A0A1A9WGW3_9MUSC
MVNIYHKYFIYTYIRQIYGQKKKKCSRYRFFHTVTEFLKLEKVEIGGLRGRQLSTRITAVYVEFNQYFTAFASKSYDVLDPDDDEFIKDFQNFQLRILELDMKLAAILCQAFDDCFNLESVFKLINIVGSVLERPKIKEQFTKKYDEIVRLLDEELTVCEEIYEQQMFMRSDNKCLYPEYNCPPAAAFIRWCSQLERRITVPIQHFQALQHDIVGSEKALEIIRRYERLLLKIGASRTYVFKDWSEKLAEQIEINLQKSLIVRDPQTQLLILNFSSELFCILREVHYLKQMEVEDIPQVALEFADKSDIFRTYTLNLEKSIDWYNTIQENSSSVELKLIESEIQQIDDLVEIGIQQLVWVSEDITSYLDKLRQPVAALQNRVNLTQGNLKSIRSIMSAWVKQPLFERRDGKKDAVLCIDERPDRTAKRYAEIQLASDEIHRLLYDNMLQFNMESKQDDVMWLNYVDFVDNIVYEHLLKTVGVSVGYIVENMDPDNNYAPLFEARLELVEPNLIFIPSLDPEDRMGFNNVLIELIRDIMKMASLIKRLKKQEKRNYGDMVKENPDIIAMRREILNGVSRVIEGAALFCRQFERYSYLWLDDRQECMDAFLEYGRILDPDEMELVLMNDPNAPSPSPPTIEAFREQIDHYESLSNEIEGIASFQVFSSWFQVDVRPFRHALLNTVCKWGSMFKSHLVNTVTSSLMDLSNFIRKADEGLLQIVKEGDYEGLVSLMAYLMQVKERVAKTDEMFEPLQETIQLLKYYDMDIPEEVNVLLQELPEQWANTKKIASTVKQQVSPLQATEVVSIRNKVSAFEIYVQEFREVFRQYNFFRFDCPDPYGLADRINADMARLESEMAEIQESGSLFEVNIPEFKLLKQCRKELRMLKVI